MFLSSIWTFFQLYYLLHSFTQPFVLFLCDHHSFQHPWSGFLWCRHTLGMRVSSKGILCCSQSGNHPENNNWAKFGYILHLKVDQKNKQNPSILFFAYVLKLIIKIWLFSRKIFETWQIWVIFSMKNPLYRLKSYFSSRNLAKKFASKRITTRDHPQQELAKFGYRSESESLKF
jgi:hypothetical protein